MLFNLKKKILAYEARLSPKDTLSKINGLRKASLSGSTQMRYLSL